MPGDFPTDKEIETFSQSICEVPTVKLRVDLDSGVYGWAWKKSLVRQELENRIRTRQDEDTTIEGGYRESATRNMSEANELQWPKDRVSTTLNQRIELGNEILGGAPGNGEELDAAKKRRLSWHDFNLTFLRKAFSTEQFAEEFDFTAQGSITTNPTFSDEVREFEEGMQRGIQDLESILGQLDLFDDSNESSRAANSGETSKIDNSKVFIVHGHDHDTVHEVAHTLERLKLQPVILHEQASGGQTLIEKFESNADVGFAIVILSGDDLGVSAAEAEDSGNTFDILRKRARQNVILELGYFFALLTRSRVCALYEEGVEIPSDIHGVLYIPLDGSGAWKGTLVREMRTAGLDADANLL